MFVKRIAVTIAVLLGVVAAAAATMPAASAQAEPYPLQVIVYACDAATCGPDDDATPLEGVAVTVTHTDGTEYGSCETVNAKPGGCSVDVDPGATVDVAVDGTTIPDGYVALDSPQTYQVPAEKHAVGDVFFYLTLQQDTVPDDQDTDEEVAGEAEGDTDTETPTELPSTGAGATQGAPAIGPLALIIAMLVAAAAFVTRRRPA